MQKSFNVIPAGPVPEVSSLGAGIQVFQGPLDRGCHRSEGFVEFCKRLKIFRIKKWPFPSPEALFDRVESRFSLSC